MDLSSILGPVNKESQRFNTLNRGRSGMFGGLANALLDRFNFSGGDQIITPGYSQQQTTTVAPLAGVAAPNTGGLDPINKFQSDLQSQLSQTQSPLNYQYYRQAATGNPQNYGGFLNYGGTTSPYSFTDQQWQQYGGSGDRSSAAGGISAYINMTNANYNALRQRLGRDPTQAEVYAVSQHGLDDTYGAIQGGNQDFFSPYSSLFL